MAERRNRQRATGILRHAQDERGQRVRGNEPQVSGEDLRRELAEAQEREAATADVLHVISRSPEDLDASLQAVADTAVRLCRADGARVLLRDGDRLIPGPGAPWQRGGGADPFPLPGWEGTIAELPVPAGEAVRTGRPVHAEDIYAYLADHPSPRSDLFAETNRRAGVTTVLAVPMLRGSETTGALAFLRRGEVRPFTEREIALAETFADQAAIAVENARLFQGIQQRNRELAEALEQQTATGEILRIIASSPADAQPVLDAIVESGARLLGTDRVALFRDDGAETLSLAAHHGFDALPEFSILRGDRSSVPGRALADRRTIHIHDVAPEVDAEYPSGKAAQARTGARTLLAVPLPREDAPLGVLVLARPEVRPFTDQQIALLETFARQAVIAMDNARLFDELQQRNRELEAASRAKSEFLSRMSHELRTPLNAIIGFAEIMEMDPATTARQHERVHHILAGGRHLLGLINEVLDITRIEAGRLSLSPEAVQLNGVVEEVLDLERPLAAEAEVRLEIEDADAFRVAVQADRQRLRQIVLNLVANGVKYNRRGGSVTLSVEALDEGNEQRATGNKTGVAGDGASTVRGEAVSLSLVGEGRGEGEGRASAQIRAAQRTPEPPAEGAGEPPALPGNASPVPPLPGLGEGRSEGPSETADSSLPVARYPLLRLSVRDTGPGIAPEDLGRLFAPFERLSAEVTGVEGTGLGLAIARGLAEAMGGAIGVESVVGEGSTFWVELPQAELPHTGLVGGGVQDPSRQGDGEGAPQVSALVLYIEDNQPNVDLVQEALQFRPGVTLLTAPDGATGLRIARRYRPSLILLDLNLPELQGDEVLARLRADDTTSAIPVVMVSADATQGQIERLLAAGARDYLTKPLDVKRLLAIVDEVAMGNE